MTQPMTASELKQAIAAALADYDRTSAVRIALDAVRTGDLEIPRLYACVLGPLLADIGASWQHGAERVWEEHLASATVRTIVESLFLDVREAADRSPSRGQAALLAAPQGEWHDLGLRMLADRMAIAGWDVHFLGANTPDREIVAAARKLGADMVVLTVATHFNRIELRTLVEWLAAQLPGTPVRVGGPAFGRVEDWPPEEIVTEADLGIALAADCD